MTQPLWAQEWDKGRRCHLFSEPQLPAVPADLALQGWGASLLIAVLTVLSYMRDWHQEEECHLPRGRGVSGPCCSVLVEGPANPHGALCTRGLPCVPWPGERCQIAISLLLTRQLLFPWFVSVSLLKDTGLVAIEMCVKNYMPENWVVESLTRVQRPGCIPSTS